MGIILYIFATILSIILGTIFGTITVLYYILTLKWKTGLIKVNNYFYHLAFAKDQSGNVMLKVAMNKLLVKKNIKPYYYGDEDDTISYATAMNFYKGKSSGLGRFIGRALDKADGNHMSKAINSKIIRDIEGHKRLMDSGMITKSAPVRNVDVDSYKRYVRSINNEERKVR